MADIFLNIIGGSDKFHKEWQKVRGEMSQLEKDNEKVNNQMRNEFNRSGDVLRKITGYLGAMFTIGAAITFIKKMVDVRVEWEKQVAILKTLTGSQREAERTMKMIKEIAELSLSPISEISDAYIRLVNQGIKPTKDQMKKMLDVAMSSGRSFGQLAEAIFDASNGQTRGMKDFGIVSKIEGNKIQLSFKGMTKEVENTAKAISEFVFQAGEMKGVAGASEEVAKTLPGVIDDIGDAWESFMLTLGEKSTGIVIGMATALKNLIQQMEKFARMDPTLQAKDNIDSFIESIKDLDKAGKIAAIDEYINKLQITWDMQKGIKGTEDYRKAISLTQQELIKYRTEIETNTDTQTKNIKEVDETTKAIEELMKSIPTLSDKAIPGAIKELESLKAKYKELTGTEYEQVGVIGNIKNAIDGLVKILPFLSADQLPAVEARITNLNEQLKILSSLIPAVKLQEIDWSMPPEAPGVNEWPLPFDKEMISKEADEVNKELEDESDFIGQVTEQIANERIDQENKLTDALLAEEERRKQAREAIYQGLAEAAMSYTDLISAKNRSAMDKELAEAEGNEKAQEEIKKKYARKEQSVAVGKAVISGALAVMRIAESWSWNPPVEAALIALQAIATALQIATIKAQKFSTGVLSLKGAGSETSDSIPSMLSRGESVMTAKETREYFPYLKAMKEGRFPHLDIDLMREFGKMEKVTNNNLNYDNSREIKELRQIQELLKKHGETQYQEGSQRVIRKGNVTTRININ